MSWTQPADVQNAWIGDDVPEDQEQVQLWIDRAERKIRREIPGISERLATAAPGHDEDLPETVRDVVADMVTEVYRNPERIRQTQTTTGPMSGTVTYGGDNPGALVLTDEQRAALLPARRARRGAFEIDTYPGAGHTDSPLMGAWVNGPDEYAPGYRG